MSNGRIRQTIIFEGQRDFVCEDVLEGPIDDVIAFLKNKQQQAIDRGYTDISIFFVVESSGQMVMYFDGNRPFTPEEQLLSDRLIAHKRKADYQRYLELKEIFEDEINANKQL